MKKKISRKLALSDLAAHEKLPTSNGRISPNAVGGYIGRCGRHSQSLDFGRQEAVEGDTSVTPLTAAGIIVGV